MSQSTHENDGRHQGKPIASWQAIETQGAPFGDQLKILRILVTYPDGRVRIFAPSFADRVSLDEYVARFHHDFAGREVLPAEASI
jgi:hypothetical protein